MALEKDTTFPKASHGVVSAGIVLYVGGLFLMISFFSPYWISSYDESFSSFKNMGVWEYCFENFRFPYYQFDKVFDGCRWILSDEYYVIREWLLPGWLLVLEFLISIALFSSLASELVLACVVLRYPQEYVLRYEHILIYGSYIGVIVSSVCIFFMAIIFPLNCWRRDWIMYPMFNHLSWAYYSLLPALLFHLITVKYLRKEAKVSYERREENRSLVMQMYPRHDRNGFY